MDMSVQLRTASGTLCTLSLSFNDDGPLGERAATIGDTGTYVARYDELNTGHGETVELASAPGVHLQDREFVAAIHAGRRPEADVTVVLPSYRILAKLEEQLDGARYQPCVTGFVMRPTPSTSTVIRVAGPHNSCGPAGVADPTRRPGRARCRPGASVTVAALKPAQQSLDRSVTAPYSTSAGPRRSDGRDAEGVRSAISSRVTTCGPTGTNVSTDLLSITWYRSRPSLASGDGRSTMV